MSSDPISSSEQISASQPPEGWTVLHPEDPFNQANGPFFLNEDFDGGAEEPARLGFRVGPHNCSFTGLCHGGVIASALDNALGQSAQAASGAAHAPTISLSVDFVSAAGEGDWLESRVRIIRKTRSLIFADALLLGPAGLVARASGIFKPPKQV
jgi:acyl-coenzyme A thioesterase PaaI-like protein